MTGDKAREILSNKDDYSNAEVRVARAYLEGCIHTKKQLGEGIIADLEKKVKRLTTFVRYVKRNTDYTNGSRNSDGNLNKLFDRAEKELKTK